MSKSLQKSNRFVDFYNTLEDFFTDITPSTILSDKSFKIDVRENEKEYIIDAELPGVKKEEINVKLEDGTLTITVEREEKVDETKDNYIHRERKYGVLQRSFHLANADDKDSTAKFEDGVLEITIPKEEKPDKSTKIEIK